MSPILSPVVPVHRIKWIFVVFVGLLCLHASVFVLAKNDTTGKNLFQDSDQDGLSNEEEKVYGTNPNNPDSDSDGYTDGAEVKNGYDPLKPAPGDKLVPDETVDYKNGKGGDSTGSVNITQEVSNQLAEILQNSNGNLNPEDLTANFNDILGKIQEPIELPDIDTSKIQVKKQTYANLSNSEKERQISKDTLEYASSVAYILANNSPIAIHSEEDVPNVLTQLSQQALQITTLQDLSSLDELEKKGQAALEQLDSIEVPENMFDYHVKALQIAQYAVAIKQDLKPNAEDPLSSIYALSKMQALLGVVSDFSTELDSVFLKYGVNNVPILSKNADSQ